LKAVLLKEFGDHQQLYLGDTADPTISSDEVLVKVEAAALNRADILQRRGLYPPPSGTSEILGMEIAGKVIDADTGARDFLGKRVMALLSGGGYAEYVTVHKSLLLEIPSVLDMYQAAGLMEAFLTGWQALVWLGKLNRNESVLIHAGASGVGTACIQLAKKLGAKVFITASAAKHEVCRNLGADHCIDYHSQNFESEVMAHNSHGVNLIIDFIGNSYLKQNLNALSSDGRLILLGFLGGTKPVRLNFAPVLYKRLTIHGSTLRSRSLEYRGNLVEDFRKHCYQDLASGRIKPVIDKIISWKQVREAHQYMEENKNRGKIILNID
jgi:putative PIG3 family NAD(P)H quinone oxidoreductase